MPDTSTAGTLADVLVLLADIRDTLRAQTRPASELLTRDDMSELLNVGVSTFDRLKAASKVGPKPMELAGLKWHRAEVFAWINTRDHAGELYDAKSWPAVWAALQAKSKTR